MKIFQGMLAAGLLASTLYPCQTQAQVELTARSVSSSQIDLRWLDITSNEGSFELQYANNAEFQSPRTITVGRNSTSYSHTGLRSVTTNHYRVRAIPFSAWSDRAFATTAPGNVVARAVSSSAIDVDWRPNSTNTHISGYTVRYSTDAGSCKDTPVAGGGSSAYRATGLVPSKTYKVSVRADGNPYSSPFSAPANATTSSNELTGTRISPLFFGQNAWLPERIGTVDKFGDLEELLCGASYGGPGDQCVPSEVFLSGVKLMRYGGKTVDKNYDPGVSLAQYLTMVDNMRANGIEPLLQVPYWDGDHSKEDAAALVRYINITNDRCVRYWTIANEPNKEYPDPDDGNVYNLNAAAIARYFKNYVTAMRNVDPTIVIVGPDLNFYDDDIMGELLAPGGQNDICGLMKNADGSNYIGPDGNTHYYLDVVDFHDYPFPHEDGSTQSRQQVLDAVDDFEGDLEDLKDLVEGCNTTLTDTRTGTSALKMAVTEINVEYDNDILDNDTVDMHLPGVNAQSFLAGQYWASVMSVGMKNGLEFMAFWSVKEGSPEIGYIAADDDIQVDPRNIKLSTYYHYQMLAQHFRGVYKPATLSGSTTNVKAFGAKDLDQIVVMLLNQNRALVNPDFPDPNATLAYTVRLDNSTINSSPLALKVNINANVNAHYSGEIAAQQTVMLVFDAAGVLEERHVYGLSDGTAGPTVILEGTGSRVAPPKKERPPKPKHPRH